MPRIKYVFIYLFLLMPLIASANQSKDILIQINGKYLTLKEAVVNKNIKLETSNNMLQFKIQGSYYPINRENILLFFDRQQLTIDIKNTYSNTKVYLDNYLKGITDNRGFAHYSQIYPEIGKHKIKMVKSNANIPPFEFDLGFKKALTISCSGKKDFNCKIIS